MLNKSKQRGRSILALKAENDISLWARFFVSLRCALNDKLLYVLVNKRITTIDAIGSISLSKLIEIGSLKQAKFNCLGKRFKVGLTE